MTAVGCGALDPGSDAAEFAPTSEDGERDPTLTFRDVPVAEHCDGTPLPVCTGALTGPSCTLPCVEDPGGGLDETGAPSGPPPDCSFDLYCHSDGSVYGLAMNNAFLWGSSPSESDTQIENRLKDWLKAHEEDVGLAPGLSTSNLGLTRRPDFRSEDGSLTIFRFAQTCRGLTVLGPDTQVRLVYTPDGAISLSELDLPKDGSDMRIAFIGAGNVGAPLAARLAEAGHEVALAEAREASKSVAAALTRSKRLVARPLAEALREAEVVFLATPFGAIEDLLRPIASQLAGKVLIDCTNPVGPGLTHGLRSERSGSELIQSIVPDAKVVKAFSIYGFENLEQPSDPGYAITPAMLFCGDDGRAKQLASKLIADCGFEPFDVGGLVQALHLEHMTLLWVRMVRAGGHSPRLVWGALELPKRGGA